MSVLESKGEMHQWLASLEGDQVVAKFRQLFLDFLKEMKQKESDWWYELTPAQQADLELALLEIEDESNLVSHDQAMEMFRNYRTAA